MRQPAHLLALLLLSGCGLVSDGWFEENVRDLDGDGAISERFGGPDCRDNDPNITLCDEDGDGALAIAAGGDDCDDQDAAVLSQAVEVCNGKDDDCDGLTDDDDGDIDINTQLSWFLDQDQDGFFDPDSKTLACQRPNDHYFSPAEKLGEDCNDEVPSINPAADENCEAVDRNCNGDFYDNAVIGAVEYYFDQDGDGYGTYSNQFCEDLQPANYVRYGDDCDDNNPEINPGQPELSDQPADENCDPSDDGDADGDGYSYPTDCDDTKASVFPGAEEIGCNGLDDNCNNLIDDLSDVPKNTNDPAYQWFLDADGDGYGDPNQPRLSCYDYNVFHPDERYVQNNTDCNDSNPNISPGSPEIYYNSIDENCAPADDFDQDGDGFSTNNLDAFDCDDTNREVHPGAIETCDELDNDCDGSVDQLVQTFIGEAGELLYRDADGDNQGSTNDNAWIRTCNPDLDGYVSTTGDCDDSNSLIRSGADEYCDAIDHNCDGFATLDAVNAEDLFADLDGDGQGDPNNTLHACGGDGFVVNNTDCDDEDATVYLGAPELCDGVDSNCHGDLDSLDPAVPRPDAFYEDADGDGYYADGAVEVVVESCDNVPQNIAFIGGDCDDSLNDTYPGAPELCDGRDNNCDGSQDSALDQSILYYPDNDGDGDGDKFAQGEYSCTPRLGWSTSHEDCNDANSSVFFGADELCDGQDNDCDGPVDEDVVEGEGDRYYFDGDGDGYGDPTTEVFACTAPYAYVAAALPFDETNPASLVLYDCDDSDHLINPRSTTEYCDGVDHNCDGLINAAGANTLLVDGIPYGDDLDDDGVPGNLIAFACELPPLTVAFEGLLDCDDLNENLSPLQLEVCANGLDDDCSGQEDDGEQVLGGFPVTADNDGDGFTGPGQGAVCVEQVNDGDCDDEDSGVFPGAEERCDQRDNDCDGFVDNHAVDANTLYLDYDADGYGDPATSLTTCEVFVAGYVYATVEYDENDTSTYVFYDCDDSRGDINPTMPVELCDNIDNNCDGIVDGGFEQGVFVVGDSYGPDLDGDGVPSGFLGIYCSAPPDSAKLTDDIDCDDTNDQISPSNQEICGNSVDEDCSGDIDDGNDVLEGYANIIDVDGDGYPGTYDGWACSPSPVDTDCNDKNSTIHPGAIELCDGTDNDCDYQLDETIEGTVPFAPEELLGRTAYVFDTDKDGYGAKGQFLICDGSDVDGHLVEASLSLGEDCNDYQANYYPGAPEICDGHDTNCDGRSAREYFEILIGSQPHMHPTLTQVLSDYQCNYYMFEVEDGYTLTESILWDKDPFLSGGDVFSQGTFTWNPPPGSPAVEFIQGRFAVASANITTDSSTYAFVVNHAGDFNLLDSTIDGCAVNSTSDYSLGATDVSVSGCDNAAFRLAGTKGASLTDVEISASEVGVRSADSVTFKRVHIHDGATGVHIEDGGDLSAGGLRVENTGYAIINDETVDLDGLIANNTDGVLNTAISYKATISNSRIVNTSPGNPSIDMRNSHITIDNTLLQGGSMGVRLSELATGAVLDNVTFVDTNYGIWADVPIPIELSHSLLWDVPSCLSLVNPTDITIGSYDYSDSCDLSLYPSLSNTSLLAGQPDFIHYDPLEDAMFWDLHPAPTDTLILDQDPNDKDDDGTAHDVGLQTSLQFAYTTYTADSDFDNKADGLEYFWFGTRSWSTINSDSDQDGVLDTTELQNYTDPLNPLSY